MKTYMKDDDKSTQPAKLQDHLYAVHATDFRPSQDNHVQLARSSIATNNPMEEEVLKKLGNLRFTLHWSLGSVVPLEGLKDCEDKAVDAGKRQFAIVTLVKNLIPQLVNIYWNDTFILGNYALSDQDHVLIPEQLIEQNDTESWGNAKLHGYDPETEDLRQAALGHRVNIAQPGRSQRVRGARFEQHTPGARSRQANPSQVCPRYPRRQNP